MPLGALPGLGLWERTEAVIHKASTMLRRDET
jgi:hypothetical protein